MQRRTPEGTTTVPVPDHAELAIGTLLSIVRQSRVPRAAFESRELPLSVEVVKSNETVGFGNL